MAGNAESKGDSSPVASASCRSTLPLPLQMPPPAIPERWPCGSRRKYDGSGDPDAVSVSFRPVVSAARDQPHAVAVALDQQAVAVILDLVEPIRGAGTLMPRVGMQNSNVLNMRLR